MSYHPNDADKRLAALMEERQGKERELHEHADWFATLSIEEQIAWLQQAGKDASEALSRNSEKFKNRRKERP